MIPAKFLWPDTTVMELRTRPAKNATTAASYPEATLEARRTRARERATFGYRRPFDESKHPRHPAGSPGSTGGEFAPKVNAATGAEVDWSPAREEFRKWAENVRAYYTPEEFKRLSSAVWADYQNAVNTQLPALQARLNAAQVPGLTITPQLNPQAGGDLDVVSDPEKVPDYGPDFEVELPAAEGGMPPGFTVWTYPEGANARHANDPDWYEQPEGTLVEEVLDITDTDFFPDGPDSSLAGDYARAVDAARGTPDEPGFVTIYRGMSGKEYDAWENGEEIPIGKWFAGIPTAQYAQDISGEPPELYAFRVPKSMLMQTGEHEYQMKKKGRMRNGVIEPDDSLTAAGEGRRWRRSTSGHSWDPAEHPREPAGTEKGGQFAARLERALANHSMALHGSQELMDAAATLMDGGDGEGPAFDAARTLMKAAQDGIDQHDGIVYRGGTWKARANPKPGDVIDAPLWSFTPQRQVAGNFAESAVYRGGGKPVVYWIHNAKGIDVNRRTDTVFSDEAEFLVSGKYRVTYANREPMDFGWKTKPVLKVGLEPVEEPVSAAAYDESKHPRDPGGEGGGQWVKKGAFEGNVFENIQGRQYHLPDGEFDPDGKVKFWPDKIGEFEGEPTWKAFMTEDGKPLAFWFVDRQGQPHHHDMGRALPDRYSSLDREDLPEDGSRQVEVGGFGDHVDYAKPTRWMPAGLAAERERARLKELAQDIPRPHRKDIADARIMMTGPVAAAAWDESKHPREPAGTPEGGQFAHYYGARRVAGEGYQAFRMVRGDRARAGVSTNVGPVRETYPEAAQDARDADDAEKKRGGLKRTAAGDKLAERLARENGPEGIKALWEDDPRDAVATLLDLNNAPTQATIERAKDAVRADSRIALQMQHPDGFITIFRGGEGRENLKAWSLDRQTALYFAGGDHSKIKQARIPIAAVEAYLPALANGRWRGFTGEAEVLLPAGARIDVNMTAAGYNPSQLRAPAGDKRGGQWIDWAAVREEQSREAVERRQQDQPVAAVGVDPQSAKLLSLMEQNTEEASGGVKIPHEDYWKPEYREQRAEQLQHRKAYFEKVTQRIADRLKDDPAFNALPGILALEVGDEKDRWMPFGTTLEKVKALHQGWADAQGSFVANALRDAVADEFGLEKPAAMLAKDRWRNNSYYTQMGPAYGDPGLRSFVRAVYDETQAELQRLGIDELTVYRGDTTRSPTGVWPASATALRRETADGYAKGLSNHYGMPADGVVRRMVTPASNVWSLPWTGVGEPESEEVILIGERDLKEHPVRAAAFDESKHPRHPAGTEEGGEFAPKSGGTESVLDKLRVSRDTPEGDVADAVRLVDQTLVYPRVPGERKIPVVVTPMEQHDATFGRTMGREPNYIRVSEQAREPRSSAVHEMGHYLDSLLGQDEWAAKGELPTKVPGTDISVWDAYSSEQSTGTLAPVITAIQETGMYHTLLDAARSDQARPRFSYGGREFGLPSEHINYLLDPPELIARSFEQYIAAKNPESKLARSSRHFFSPYEGMVPVSGPGYLKGADLEGVVNAWDTVLSERGLLRTKPGILPPSVEQINSMLEEGRAADRKLKALQTS